MNKLQVVSILKNWSCQRLSWKCDQSQFCWWKLSLRSAGRASSKRLKRCEVWGVGDTDYFWLFWLYWLFLYGTPKIKTLQLCFFIGKLNQSFAVRSTAIKIWERIYEFMHSIQLVHDPQNQFPEFDNTIRNLNLRIPKYIL